MAAKDPTLTRIISHMNNDHQDSLVRYLEHYCEVSSSKARRARLDDLTLTEMVIRTTPKKDNESARSRKNHRYIVPFDPPLQSFSQVRERVVAMDKECLSALDRSDITVKKWLPPTGAHAVGFLVTLGFYALIFRRENLVPGGQGAWYPWSLFGEKFPQAAGWLYEHQPKIFLPLLAVHFLEVILMDVTRLRKHSVPRGSALWWKFVITHQLEGFTSFIRFDRYIKQREAEKAVQGKH